MPRVVIATPLEPELVARLRAVDERLDVAYEADLLPTPRWASDHIGDPTFAGAGQQLSAAGLAREDVERITWTSSVGIHITPLGEWALFGILALTKDLPRLEA